MAANLPPCPASMKAIAHYLKMAQEHDQRDAIVAYWARLYALQTGLKVSTKQPEETALLIGIMEWLETAKRENASNESITNEIVAQAYLENYALKLFTYADQQDRACNFVKNVVKAFYTSGLVYDVLLTFGELSDEAQKNSKYAKWKAAYIHNCLKNGETPIPGPMHDDEDDVSDVPTDGGAGAALPPAALPFNPPPASQPFNPPPASVGFHPIPVDYDANTLPSPPVDPEPRNPGGFQPYVAPAQPAYQPQADVASNITLNPEQMIKAQKYCKWAGSALNYDDVKSAIDNLQKALRLLQTGQDG